MLPARCGARSVVLQGVVVGIGTAEGDAAGGGQAAARAEVDLACPAVGCPKVQLHGGRPRTRPVISPALRATGRGRWPRDQCRRAGPRDPGTGPRSPR